MTEAEEMIRLGRVNLIVNLAGVALIGVSLFCFYKCEKARQAQRSAQAWSFALFGAVALVAGFLMSNYAVYASV